MCCGRVTRGRQTHVDHIVPRSKAPELELVFDNLQVLCKRCNQDKDNKHSTDYRPKYEGKTRPGHRSARIGAHWADGYTVEEVMVAKAAVEQYRTKKA